MNGSILEISSNDYKDRLCQNIDFQTIAIFSTSFHYISDEKIKQLVQEFSKLMNINPLRVNIISRSSDEWVSQYGEIIISIMKSNGSEKEHSSVIYEFAKYSDSMFINFLKSADIEVDDIKVKVLTYNETIGTKTGCYQNGKLVFTTKLEQCEDTIDDDLDRSILITLSVIISLVVITLIITIIKIITDTIKMKQFDLALDYPVEE